MPIAIKQPLTNVQLELLKTFSHQLTDNDLLELRKILAAFFAQRLIEQANQVWDEQHWNDEKVDEILNTKMRKITKQ
ncbi:MAG: hypothetical protein IPN94_15945 [Sphingobacteriales bacterium]|jgi:hypothetical protein|nr:hypothetical protein [Sphingobacteriales bacterium]